MSRRAWSPGGTITFWAELPTSRDACQRISQIVNELSGGSGVKKEGGKGKSYVLRWSLFSHSVGL